MSDATSLSQTSTHMKESKGTEGLQCSRTCQLPNQQARSQDLYSIHPEPASAIWFLTVYVNKLMPKDRLQKTKAKSGNKAHQWSNDSVDKIDYEKEHLGPKSNISKITGEN